MLKIKIVFNYIKNDKFLLLCYLIGFPANIYAIIVNYNALSILNIYAIIFLVLSFITSAYSALKNVK
jgi:hypothetical protein